MIFLVLDSYIEPPIGYPGRPYFDSDVWPLIVTRSDEIKSALWFHHDRSPDHTGLRQSPVTDLGPMAKLSAQTIDMLKHKSYYGGHLNVLYVIPSESPLLTELVNLYPAPGVIDSDSTNDLALSFAVRSELTRFVEALPRQLVVLSFAHDGDPAFIFGERAALEKLQVGSMANRPKIE
jgi:hypothetical protein